MEVLGYANGAAIGNSNPQLIKRQRPARLLATQDTATKLVTATSVSPAPVQNVTKKINFK